MSCARRHLLEVTVNITLSSAGRLTPPPSLPLPPSLHITLYVVVYYYQAYIAISPYYTLCHGLLLSDVHWYQSILHTISWFIIVICISPYHTLCHGLL